MISPYLPGAKAGLFSAVTSAFIIQFDSQLQPDSNDETAALLRVLIYKIDNTTFGNSVPSLPQWSGPPHTIVQVQAILFASLAVSLLSAFLAMLGKQWLNRYESIDKRGLAIERSHNRQQKLGGIVGWYFDHVMESLPMMLQAALLLLGCALTLYLWGVNITVASVVLSITSFGAIFYIFIAIAGTASDSCPYQTPPAHIFRFIFRQFCHNLLPALRSASVAISGVASSSLSRLYQASWCCRLFPGWWVQMNRPWYSMKNVLNTLLALVFLPIALALDVYSLGRAIVKLMVAFCRAVHRRVVGGHRMAHRWFIDISSLRTPGLDPKAVILTLECISWILQTSLDKAIHLTTLEYLISLQELVRFDPILVFDCFNMFTRCINVGNGKVVVTQGSEQLAKVSAKAFFRTFHHLATNDPTSSALADLQRRYNEAFPSELDFTSLPFRSTMTKIHALAGRFGNPRDIRWHNYRMTIHEHVPFAQHMLQAAREGYRRTGHTKVPRWILHSALYFLSLSPVSPPSAVADCLTIVAIDLGCNVPNTVNSDERYVQI